MPRFHLDLVTPRGDGQGYGHGRGNGVHDTSTKITGSAPILLANDDSILLLFRGRLVLIEHLTMCVVSQLQFCLNKNLITLVNITEKIVPDFLLILVKGFVPFQIDVLVIRITETDIFKLFSEITITTVKTESIEFHFK